MKKTIVEFIIALLILVMSLAIGGYVLHLLITRKGDIFGRNGESTTQSTTGRSSSKAKTTSTQADDYTGTMWIGDSRFVGMDKAVDITSTDRNFLVAKIGQGLPWFKNTALTSVKKIRSKNSALKTWRYVICLGVNDLKDIDNYIEEYKTLTAEDSKIELILVSVNPVKDYPSISNSQIEAFNEKLKDACDENGWYYIDTYTTLMDQGYKTTDGLHYDNDTYKTIYQGILDGLSEYESEKQKS